MPVARRYCVLNDRPVLVMHASSSLSIATRFLGPILWGHSGPLCHALSLLSSLLWTSMPRRRATVATPGEWQCKTGGVQRLAVANASCYIMRSVYTGKSVNFRCSFEFDIVLLS